MERPHPVQGCEELLIRPLSDYSENDGSSSGSEGPYYEGGNPPLPPCNPGRQGESQPSGTAMPMGGDPPMWKREKEVMM